MLVTSRPLDEYCELFGLSRRELCAVPGRILDCPGGAAGLVAEACALGVEVIATDPAYAAPIATLAARAREGRAAMAAAMAAAPQLYPPLRHQQPARYLRGWDRARRLFEADATGHPSRYVAAALPHLPFADGSFALTLSSYLLFAYPELFPPAAQLAGLLELVRVTAPDGEARIYPLHDGTGRRCPHLPELRAALRHHHVASRLIALPRPGAPGRTRTVLLLTRASRSRQAG
ncbi:class I SAM-dependent methyltransferase [Kitasatospora sp. NPDC002227]|uniref:class I SAM-dependent methyltransferase n=1 Tax=Kitasatospora sp. NPDC002227 TaxID=3154773 RepID=UPI00331A1783